MRKLIAALAGAGLALGIAPAFAGQWRLDASRCPDIREDWRDARENRRDERIDYGRRDRVEDRLDRREDRRDRAITICPRSAFYYVPGRGEWRSDAGRYDARRAHPPKLTLSYDRRLRLRYTTATGRRIYVRG